MGFQKLSPVRSPFIEANERLTHLVRLDTGFHLAGPVTGERRVCFEPLAQRCDPPELGLHLGVGVILGRAADALAPNRIRLDFHILPVRCHQRVERRINGFPGCCPLQRQQHT